MRCRTAQAWIVAGADGELAPRQQRALDRHLAGCAGCRAEQVAAEGVLKALEGLGREVEIPARMEQQVLRRVRGLAEHGNASWPARVGSRVSNLVPSLAAGAVALLAIVALREVAPQRNDVAEVRQAAAPRREAKTAVARRNRVPTDPPVALASQPDLFVDLPMLRDLEKLQHFDAIATMDGDDPTAPASDAPPTNG